jgi:hypothetical protein
MQRAMIAGFVVWVGALALTTACNEGDKKMPPFGSKSSSWNELKVPGVELLLETEKSAPYRSIGAARIDGASGVLRGKDAFDATRTRVGGDATALATLAMLFIDDGVAGRKPWTQPSGGGSTSQDQEAIARPPAVTGDSLVYWRLHVQLADLVRCTVSLAGGTVRCESGRDLVATDRVAKDPAGAAKQDLASDNIEVRIDGIRALGKVGDDHARQQLIEIALNAYQPRERSAAVEVLARIGGAGVVDALGRALLHDKFDEVREAAATALGDLRDPAGREALQRAESGDSNGRVQVLAAEALKKLR